MKNLNLTNEELCRSAKNGDIFAVEFLINNNIGFIKTIAKEVSSQYRDSVEFDDLVQEGQIAIWKCVGKFDETSGITFLTYAKHAIQNAMTDLVRKNISSAFVETDSLEEYIENREQRLWLELTSEFYLKTPERAVLQNEQILELYEALRSIEARERTYLLYRFGFEDGQEHSVANTAFHFSLSESRAKSIEKAALNKMRKLMFG